MAIEAELTSMEAKIPALGLHRRLLACGSGWSVSHVTCELGPHDGVHEEQHSQACIAIVRGGSFQYRSTFGRELMMPGSLLLGNPGQCVEYSHDHAVGDRCIAFSFTPEYFEAVASDAAVNTRSSRFSSLRIPPAREMSGVLSRACALYFQQSRLTATGIAAKGVQKNAEIPDSNVSQWDLAAQLKEKAPEELQNLVRDHESLLQSPPVLVKPTIPLQTQRWCEIRAKAGQQRVSKKEMPPDYLPDGLSFL